MKPKISVIVTTYNRCDKLPRALDSIVNQTFRDWEIVLVDDCSTDETQAVAEEYLKKLGDKMQYIRRKKNFGQHTRPKNEGTMAAKADLIAYLDDDNAFRRDHLQALYKELERYPELDMVYGMRMLVDENGEQPESAGVSGEFSLRRLQFQNYIDTADILAKKSSIDKVGGWNETLNYFADWNLWLRMAKANMIFKQIPIILTDYYVHAGMNQLKHEKDIDPVTGLVKPPFDPTSCSIWPEKTKYGKEPPLKVAIFTLTYDRLDYTKKTFETMAALAGYDYDHYVVDNGSTDGTVEWLKEQDIHAVIFNEKNVGISKASNQALEAIGKDYDIIIKVDNDCAFLTENWLKRIVDIFRCTGKGVMSPYVGGLMENPGGVPRKRIDNPEQTPFGHIGDEFIGFVPHLGGICIAAPAAAYEGFRWKDNDFYHGIQDLEFSQNCLRKGLLLFYLENVKVEHQDSTSGQEERFPDYFERRKKEKITKYGQSA